MGVSTSFPSPFHSLGLWYLTRPSGPGLHMEAETSEFSIHWARHKLPYLQNSIHDAQVPRQSAVMSGNLQVLVDL